MASLMTRSLIVLLCWAMVGVCGTEAFCRERFMKMYNGYFTNRISPPVDSEILSKEGPVVPDIDVRIKNVSVPVLKDPVVYFEMAVNGQVVLALVYEVAGLPTKNGVLLTVYNATDASRYKFDEFNTSDLSTYDRDAFQLYEGCPKEYIEVSEVFVGAWEKCRGAVNGKFTKYLIVFNENGAEFIQTDDELGLYGVQVYNIRRINKEDISED